MMQHSTIVQDILTEVTVRMDGTNVEILAIRIVNLSRTFIAVRGLKVRPILSMVNGDRMSDFCIETDNVAIC